MPETGIERFVGDQVRRLQLTSRMFEELHRTTGKGALALYGAVLNREASHRDLTEIVRCALIGGGTAPQEAAALVAIYIDPSPILPVLTLVLEILDAAFEGVEPAPPAPPAPQVANDTVSVAREIAPNVYRMSDGTTQLNLDEVA